jgi:hypothetical protein
MILSPDRGQGEKRFKARVRAEKGGREKGRDGGRDGVGEGRRTSFLMVAHEIFTNADLVRVHEIQNLSHFLLVPAFVLVRHGEVLLEEGREEGEEGGKGRRT